MLGGLLRDLSSLTLHVFTQELNKLDNPREVIQKFERMDGKTLAPTSLSVNHTFYLSPAESMKTQEVLKEYLKALVLSNRIDGANLSNLTRGTFSPCSPTISFL